MFRSTMTAASLLLSMTVFLSESTGSTYSDYVINSTGPVLYWSLDETSGTTATDLVPGVGGANDGTYIEISPGGLTLGQAGPRPSEGYRNMASTNAAPQVTRGLTQYTSLSSTAGVGTGSYSVQAWVNPASDFTANRLNYAFTRGNTDTSPAMREGVHIGGSLAGYLQGGLNYYHYGPEQKVPGSRLVSPGTWYHVVMVHDGSDVKVFLNGREEIQATQAYEDGNGNSFNVGHRPDYAGLSDLGWRGRYDEVAVWDRPLATSEVGKLYEKAVGSHYAATVLNDAPEAYWRLDETTGTNTAHDETGHGHDFDYDAASSRTGTGLDVGPRPPEFKGLEPDNNAPLLVTGVDSQKFLGIAEGVLPGTPGGTNNDYSLEMWIRRDGPLGYAGFTYLMNRNDAADDAGDFLGITSYDSSDRNLLLFNGVWPANHSTGYHTGTTPIEEDQWYHVGMIREGNHVSAYLNGVLEVEGTLTTKAETAWSLGKWAFGNRMDSPSHSNSFRFNGNMDEIAIYAGAVDPNLFMAHYLAATVPEPSTIVLSLLGLLGLVCTVARRRSGRP